MIHEIALLPVHPGHIDLFRQAFAKVAPLLTRAKGYRGHALGQGVETPQVFTLIVRWESLEDHTPTFEASEDHRVFMLGLQDYLSGEPTVFHVEGAVFATGEQGDVDGGLRG